jgi:hypothetical protein
VHSIVAFAPAAPIVGACVSTCVIVCDTVAELLPQASTATHVLVVVFVQLLPPVTSPPTRFTVTALQASVAVGAVKTVLLYTQLLYWHQQLQSQVLAYLLA